MKRQTKKPDNGNARQGLHVSMLTDFFNDQLKDIYWAEKHLVKTLPKMKKAASSEELATAFEDHLEVTKQHVIRLEKIFEIMGNKPESKKCDGIEGLTKEGESIVEETQEGTATRDVGLIFAAQKVEHYEIATYGSLHQLALTLEYNEIADLIDSTLNEEKEADKTLTSIAKTHVNYDALEEA